MVKTLLSLLLGIFVGWHLHNHYFEIQESSNIKRTVYIETPPRLKESESKPPHHQKTLPIREKREMVVIKKSQPQKEIKIVEKREADNSFQISLLAGEFQNAMAFYLEGDEEEIKLYQEILLSYFKKLIKENPERAVEEMEHYLDIAYEPKEIQFLLYRYFMQIKNYPKALALMLSLHQNYEDDEFTLLLAELYEKLNNYERAVESLNEINQDSIYFSKVSKSLKRLKVKQEEYLNYPYKIPLKRVNAHYAVEVTLENQAFTLMLDTGATYTFVNREKFSSSSQGETIQLSTAGGLISAQLVTVERLQIDEIEIPNFKVTLAPFESTKTDGLLGMNFFRHFDFKIDQKRSMLYLSKKIERGKKLQ